MIHINLLPEEYRRKVRTPLKAMLAILCAVALNASLAAYAAWLMFGVAAKADSEKSVAQLEMDGLTPQVNYHNALESETKVYAQREKTLGDITSNRMLWTKKVDELIDVVNFGDDGLRHYVWFDDLNVQQTAGDKRTTTYGDLKADGHSGSAQWDQVAVFLGDIEDPEVSDFILDFTTLAWPEGTQSSKDPELVPSEVWAFPLQVSIKSPQERNGTAPAVVPVKEAAK